jgi:peptide/nickel transport system substrate-binding protein
VVGAADYSKGKASSVSGITTNDATGQITVHLMAPYGAFVDVLAVGGAIPFMPAATTPMKPEPNNPPVGFGPYVIKNVAPNVSFSLVRNPKYPAQASPGIPAGHMDIKVKIETNTTTEASDVLNNRADVFDWSDTIPPALIQQVQRQTSRYRALQTNKTFYWFLNTTEKPFNNATARQAVAIAVDRPALADWVADPWFRAAICSRRRWLGIPPSRAPTAIQTRRRM